MVQLKILTCDIYHYVCGGIKEKFFKIFQQFFHSNVTIVFFSGITIQAGVHDSTEDARTALSLYLKYKEMSKEGMEKVKRVGSEDY